MKKEYDAYDGDYADLTTNDSIYPSYSGYQTGYGHTDSIGDYDFATLCVTASSYYDIASTGNTAAYVYDATAGSWVNGGDYQKNLFLDSSHINYLYVCGYTAGESYSVTLTLALTSARVPSIVADNNFEIAK